MDDRFNRIDYTGLPNDLQPGVQALQHGYGEFHRKWPSLTYYGNLPSKYSENTVSWIEWMGWLEGWVAKVGADLDNLNQDFNDFVDQYNDFLATYNQEVAETRGMIDDEKAQRTSADNDLQNQIDMFNTNVGFNFGRQKILTNKFNSNIDDVGGETPLYYEEILSGSVFTGIPQDNFNVGFITDSHFQYGNYAINSDKHYRYAGRIARTANLDAVVAGGDNINGDHSRTNKYNQTVNVTETLINRIPSETDTFFLLGNHDTGIGQSAQTSSTNLNVKDNLDEETIKKLYHAKEKLYDEIRNEDSLYGFKDYEKYKIRLIFINSFDLPFTNTNGVYDYNFLLKSGFQNEQLNWLANNAFKLPDNTWQVMIFSHAPLSGSFGNDSTGKGIDQYNSDALIGLINAIQNSESFTLKDQNRELPIDISADYTNQGNIKVIAFISGHVHEDGQMIFNGINCIETMCSWCNTIQRPTRLPNTPDEDAQDLFSVDRDKSKIFIYRFGYGINREFTY